MQSSLVGRPRLRAAYMCTQDNAYYSDSEAYWQAWWEPLIWLQGSLWAAFSTLPTTHAIVNTSPLRVCMCVCGGGGGVALHSLWSP